MSHTMRLFLVIASSAIIFMIWGNEVNAQKVPSTADLSSPGLTGNAPSKPGTYTKNRILIKLKPNVETQQLGSNRAIVTDERLADELEKYGITQFTKLFPKAVSPNADDFVRLSDDEKVPKPDMSLWYVADLPDDVDALEVANELNKSESVLMAEPDYIWNLNDNAKPSEIISNRDVTPGEANARGIPGPTTDPLFSDSWHLTAAKVTDAWNHLQGLGLEPGGNNGIVVAVIDTGVDYNHPDLDANMWTNTQEIPNNGIDDDSNGYIDDVHGVNVIADTGDPMDSNGHGTHVAGIIAAEGNNGIGGVGVAYNVQIMAVVAAQYSGVLASSDIAEAVQYAVSENANVINMSFGGYSESQVVKDALTVAYASAVLVAAAGNDGKYNESACGIYAMPMYPAAYPWILGVMARRQTAATNGDYLAFFSNWDCIPQTPMEYELMAPGVDIWSTLPSNQYSAWDGTSMATPIISGIAALVRTKFSDTSDYTTRFIMGQIASTGTTRQGITSGGTVKSFHDTDASAALTDVPQPQISYSKNYVFDSTAVAPGNDADGEVDAGETVDLGLIIRNHWGKATNVSATLAAWANGAVSPDPYVTMSIATVDYGAIGSFNEDDNGIIYDGSGTAVGVQYPFRFTVDASTPNGHIIPFRLTTTCKNGLTPSDATTYTSTSYFNITVQRGTTVSGEISEDTTWTSDKLWIVTGSVLVPRGITLTIEPGTKVAFNHNTLSTLPREEYGIHVDGNLNAVGTKVDRISFTSNELSPWRYAWRGIEIRSPGNANIEYCDFKYAYMAIHYNVGENPHSQDCNLNARFNNIISGEKGIRLTGCDINEPSECNVDTNIIKSCIDCTSGSSNGFIIYAYNFFFNNNIVLNYKEHMQEGAKIFYVYTPESLVSGNTFFNNYYDASTKYCGDPPDEVDMSDNYWGSTNPDVIKLGIFDYYDTFSDAKVIFEPFLTQPSSNAPPQIVSLTTSPSGQLGVGQAQFTVTFNRDMDPYTEALVAFGPAEPYTDHQVSGAWQSARTWVGTFNITPLTGDGWHTIYVGNARGEEHYMPITNLYLQKFEIVTSGTSAMTLQATGGSGYVDLSWTQDNFDLLAGYNVYRADTLGGTYSRINTNLIPDQTNSYRDTEVQAYLNYYYKFTVVKTDMAESDPSNIASGAATAAAPTVATTAVGSITTNSASSGGNITSDGGVAISSRGVCWNTSANPTTANSKTTNGTGTGSYTSSITGLSPGTTYHVRAYAINSQGTSYGSDVSFTTSATGSTVTTTAASSVTSTSASSGGNVTSDGGAAITARGVCWNTSANPTTANSKTTNGTGTGSYTSSITGLSPGTTYHVRAYAINSQGTSYGSDVSFTTSATGSTVTTTAASSVTSTSASSGGNVTSDGGAAITARGVCWSTSANPTTANSKTTNGTGTGSYTSSITGLSPGTLYHVRAYATNSQGTSYGSDVSFTTSAIAPTVFSYVSSDGNCGTKDPCHSTIQAAIDAAATGSAILVKQGTYAESLSLGSNKSLLIKGGYAFAIKNVRKIYVFCNS